LCSQAELLIELATDGSPFKCEAGRQPRGCHWLCSGGGGGDRHWRKEAARQADSAAAVAQ